MSKAKTSSSTDNSDDIGREVAKRVFAAELTQSNFSYKPGGGERSPRYIVTPTGVEVNRVFFVGVATNVKEIKEDKHYRVRVSDPSATVHLYARYNRDAVELLQELETPSYVAIIGKPRTYSPEDSDEIYTYIQPETINKSTPNVRDRWVVETAERTLERIKDFENSLNKNQFNNPQQLALNNYHVDNEDLDDLRGIVGDALEKVGGQGENQDETNGEIKEESTEEVEESKGVADEKKKNEEDIDSKNRGKDESVGSDVETVEDVGEENSQESLRETVLGVIEEHDGIVTKEILDRAELKGLDREEADDVLTALLSEGIVYPSGDGIKPI